MDALQFYNAYGMYIHIGQNVPAYKNMDFWPYIHPGHLVVDIPITDRVIKAKFIPCGFSYPGKLTAVLYRSGDIAYANLPAHHAVISYDFSGCLMAKFCLLGVWYVCHITCIGATDSSDCKKPWKDFLHLHKNDITQLVMIRPSDDKRLLNKMVECADRCRKAFKPCNVTLAGLIAADNSCFVALVDRESGRIYDDDDANIASCPKILVCHDADTMDLLRKIL